MNIVQKIYNHPYFDNSVRTFFPLAALIAIFVPLYTVCVIVNGYHFPIRIFNIYQWHAYEMLFGFTFTLFIGFILTAAGHWTGSGALSKRPLLILLVLSIIDHSSLFIFKNVYILIVTSSLASLYFMYRLNILINKYKMKYVFLFFAASLTIMKVFFLINQKRSLNIAPSITNEIIYDFALWVYILMTTLIAGRVIPNFTKNYFKLPKSIKEPGYVTKFTFISTILLLVNMSDSVDEHIKFGICLLLTIVHLYRMSFWKTHMAIRKPIIGFLHIGYFLLICSIFFMGLTYIIPEYAIFKSSIHFTILGAISFIALNIMMRASLGHTGREIKMTPALYAMFICLLIGTIIRVFIPIINPSWFMKSLHHSMGWWTLAFCIYLIKFFPMFLKKRIS